MSNIKLDRRRFLKLSSASVFGAGLVLAIRWQALPADDKKILKNTSQFQPNIWLKIGTDGRVTVFVVESEMGQGSSSLMPMILAEELEVAWDDIAIQRAPLKPAFGYQATGGSSSIRKGWATLRSAGAMARQMLVQAAAQQWSVDPSGCYAQHSQVIHKQTGKQLSFAQLAELAATLPIPENVSLKSPNEYKILGTSVPRLDIPGKVDGSAQFGIDVRLPDMLFATTVHCPVIGGKAKKINDSKAKQIVGVEGVYKIENAVAVVAKDTWTAMQAAKALEIEWDEGKNKNLSSQQIQQQLETAAKNHAQVKHQQGDINSPGAVKTINARYDMPFQAHVPMEPMNCTALINDQGCQVWAPTQSPSKAKSTAEQYGLSKFNYYLEKISRRLDFSERDAVDVHTTLLGGGFGRRIHQDYVAEAVQIARQLNQPVNLTWSREEDIQHDFYHPHTFHVMQGSVDANGKPHSWWHRIAAVGRAGSGQLPYAIPNSKIDLASVDIAVPIGPWRSVKHHYYAFAQETFFDELAALGKQDPLQLRLELLTDPRLKKVLQLAADKAQWGRPLAEGHFLGLAVHKSFGTYVAEAVEIALDDKGEVNVIRVVVAVDCGIVINKDTLIAQMESSVVFGLSAALKSPITLKDGRVQQNNFYDYPILKMSEMPRVDVFIVKNNESPQGIGEPAVPPLAPALANAIFAATGSAVSGLPFV